MANSSSWWVVMLIALLVALINVAGHWCPWHVIPGVADERGRLRRLLAYAYGVVSIWLGMAAIVLLWSVVAWETPAAVLWLLTVMMVAAGIGTLAGYLVDVLHEHQALQGDVADYEQADHR